MSPEVLFMTTVALAKIFLKMTLLTCLAPFSPKTLQNLTCLGLTLDSIHEKASCMLWLCKISFSLHSALQNLWMTTVCFHVPYACQIRYAPGLCKWKISALVPVISALTTKICGSSRLLMLMPIQVFGCSWGLLGHQALYLNCAGSLQRSTLGRKDRSYSRVWATFIGASLSLIACLREAILLSWSPISFRVC